MKKFLLPSILALGCIASANASVQITNVEVPEGVTYGETADLKLTVLNEDDAISDYKVTVYRYFTPSIKEEVATLEGKDLASETSEISVPIDFTIGGNWNLIVELQCGSQTLTETTDVDVKVPIEGNSLSMTLPSKNYTPTFGRDLSVFNDNYYLGDQCVYPNDLIDLPREAIINKLTYYYRPWEYGTPDVRMKIYLGTVDADVTGYDSKALYTDNSELVFDDVMPQFTPFANPGEEPDQAWELVLGRPFSYDPSQNLVITIQLIPDASCRQNSIPDLVTVTRDNDCNLAVYWWKESSDILSLTSTNRNQFKIDKLMPVVDLSYQLTALPEATDMGIGDVTVPSNITVGEDVKFRIQVLNEGTSVVNNFKLELLDVRNGLENAEVLASADINETYGPSSEGIERFTYAFENVETYELAFRIVVDDDVEESNNVSDVFQVAVGPAVGVESVSADSDVLRFAEGRIFVGLAGASSLSVAAADGRVVFSAELNGEGEIDAALQNGVYVARLSDNDGKAYIAKFIVK